MRIKKTFLAFAILLALHLTISAQDSTKKLNIVIKTDLFFPTTDYLLGGWQTYTLTLEKFIATHHSFQLTYLNTSKNTPDDFPSSFHTFQIIPEYKFYFFHKRKYSGLYTGLYVKYASIHTRQRIGAYGNSYIAEDVERMIGPGVIGGFQFYPWRDLTLDFLIGLGYSTTISRTVISGNFGQDDPNGHLDGRIAINIGYRF